MERVATKAYAQEVITALKIQDGHSFAQSGLSI
jgi:hypothetical protein